MSAHKLPLDYELVSPWGRIKLAPAKDDDNLDMIALRIDPETRRYLPYMPADLTLEQWKQRRKERSDSKETWDLNIYFTSQEDCSTNSSGQTSSFVGECGVSHIDFANKTGEVGVIIRSDLYRKFIATETLYCNLVLAFEHPQLELHRVSFVTAAINVRMRNWLERFGIALEYRKKDAWSDGEGGRLDVVVYTIFRRDWPALKDRMKEELDRRLLNH